MKKRFSSIRLALRTFPNNAKLTLQNYIHVVEFIKDNELWRGILAYRWLSRIFTIAGILVGLKFLQVYLEWWNGDSDSTSALSSLGGLFGSLFSEGYDLFALGSLKYVILILLEVVIFHFSRKTLEILRGEEIDHSFKTFLRAQIRMVGVSLYSLIMETILAALVASALSFVLLGSLKPVFILLIQCYFLGFAIVDNYNEVFGMKLRESARFTRQYWSVALVTGLMAYILMLVPVIGVVIGPLTGAVAATITMHELTEGSLQVEQLYVGKE